MATTLLLCKWTGGEFNYYKDYQNPELVHNKLFRMLSCEYVGDVAFKVRTSKNLFVSNYHGNLLNKDNVYIELSGFDSDKSVVVEINYNNNFDKNIKDA